MDSNPISRRVRVCAPLLALVAATALATAPALAGGDPDGRYKGKVTGAPGQDPFNQGTFKMKVAKNGTKLKRFYVALNVICSYFPPTTEYHPIGFPTTKIKDNGKFRRVWRPNDDTRILLKGKLVGTKIKNGYLDYQVGICVRAADWKARRVR